MANFDPLAAEIGLPV